MTFLRFAFLLCLLLMSGGCRESVEESGSTATTMLEALRNLDSKFVAYAEALDQAQTVAFETSHSEQEYKAALATLEAALKDPMFRRLNTQERANAYSGAAWAARRLEQNERSAAMLKKMLALAPDSEDDVLLLSRVQADLEQYNAAAATLAGYVDKWTLDRERDDFVRRVIRKADHGSPARLALLEALFKDKWRVDARIASETWYELALRQVELNQVSAAQKTITRITHPSMLVRLRSDKRFDAVIDRNSPSFDVAAAARADVARRLKGRGNPPSLSRASLELAYALLQLGDDQAALVLVERVLAEALDDEASDEDRELYSSFSSQRARVLYRLGRLDEALEQRKAAARIDARHGLDVNATLNLADTYCNRGMGAQARQTAELVKDDLSDYGKMVKHLNLHCAAVLEGDPAAAKRSLDYLRAHRSDEESIYVSALLRAGDQDQAAASIIAQLADPVRRGEVLYDLQFFLRTANRTGKPAEASRWDLLRARPDVQAAVNAVGRIETYPIYAY